MDKVLEKDIETKEEVKLILERLDEVKKGKVKSVLINTIINIKSNTNLKRLHFLILKIL